MSEAIKKINKLNIAESFIQVHFDKGYKYIDRAGQLINEFYVEDQEPIFNMNVDGMILKPANDSVSEIRVTPKTFWSHYKSPDSLDLVSTHFSKNLSKVAAILDLKNFTRIGWRTYFVKEFKTKEHRDNAFNKFTIYDSLEFHEGFYGGTVNDCEINVRLRKVAPIVDNTERGMLIDLDIYKKFESVELPIIENQIKELQKTAKSEELLNILNVIITE